jgi:hypothetical protein
MKEKDLKLKEKALNKKESSSKWNTDHLKN